MKAVRLFDVNRLIRCKRTTTERLNLPPFSGASLSQSVDPRRLQLAKPDVERRHARRAERRHI